MFEIMNTEDESLVNDQQNKSTLEQLLNEAVLHITNVATCSDIGHESTTNLLCRYGISKISSLQLSPTLRGLKKQYDDIEKKLFKLPDTPESYQALVSTKSSAQSKLDHIKKKRKDIADNLEENKKELEDLRNKYTLAIAQATPESIENIEANISGNISNTEIQKYKKLRSMH